MVRIVVDGMGGDHAPAAVIKGIKMFFEKGAADTNIICVCPEEKFKQEADEIDARLIPVYCEGYIPMDTKLSLSIMRNKDTSMHRAIQMLKNNEADVAFSAGNTAIFVSIAVSELGLLKGVDRPGICVHLPNLRDRLTLLIDAGATVSPKPVNLYQYAIMGSLYAKHVLNIENPSLGLLNVGAEPGKGDELRQNVYKMLVSNQTLNFIGNVEGHEVFMGKADVIITDGFSGNIVLKVGEEVGRAFKSMMLREINRSISGKIGFFIARNSIKSYVRKTDYAEYGGGVLLGVNGIVIVGHGRSSPRAIHHAILLGEKIASSRFFATLKEHTEKWVPVS
ncbi:MAG TPA: phosphate acyltransferase PlsX [bacterium]|nr:phosphate acyltransferase PlsX [bacterium]HOL35365.1 phosphate acyltransferase PlsX [bacterium]HPP08844.1 phosphate acyltransferase PlsX [bacterium]